MSDVSGSSIENQIINGTDKAGKKYRFNDSHDSNQVAQWWFQESPEGLVLFVVFYTQACRWSRCQGCNLPMQMSSRHISYREIIAQIDNIFSLPEVREKNKQINKFIVSNNGSVLDQKTFSSTALIYLMAMLNIHFPNLSVLTMESRPEYVDVEELEFLARSLAEGDTPTKMEFAIGFEAFDDNIRNNVFDKGLSLAVFESFVKKIAPYDYLLKCYFMQKPVAGMSDAEAVSDIKNAIEYLSDCAEKYGVKINMHLNPTYAARGTKLADDFLSGNYIPPKLSDVVEAVKYSEGKGISVFIGLSDEGLAVEGGSFLRAGDDTLVSKLEHFNRTQDYTIL